VAARRVEQTARATGFARRGLPTLEKVGNLTAFAVKDEFCNVRNAFPLERPR